MRMMGYIGPRTIAGADKDDRGRGPEPTLKKDGYVVTARACDDPRAGYALDRRRGTYLSPTRDHLFKPEEDDPWN